MTIELKYTLFTHPYLVLRKAVGWIGILLPFTLILGVLFLFNGEVIQESISHYYYTSMRDVFVGALCAEALFLFFYTGYDKWDNLAGNVAGFFAIGVAWFPPTEVGPSDWIGIIHLVSATTIGLSIFRMRRPDGPINMM